jgi:hypothetical protein
MELAGKKKNAACKASLALTKGYEVKSRPVKTRGWIPNRWRTCSYISTTPGIEIVTARPNGIASS